MNCPWCDKPFQPRAGGRPQLFCQKKCAKSAWRAAHPAYQKVRYRAARASRIKGPQLNDHPACKRVVSVEIPRQPENLGWLYGAAHEART